MAKAAPMVERLAEMLSDLSRAVRGAAIYPHRHPTRDRLLARLHERVDALLSEVGSLEFKVTSRGLTFGGDPLVSRDGSAAFIAVELFSRQVDSLTFRSGGDASAMEALTDLIRTPPETVRAEGGAAEFLRSRGVTAVAVEEVDFDGILKRREESDEATRYGNELEPMAGVTPTEAPRPQVLEDQGTPEVTQEEWLEAKLSELDAASALGTYKAVLKDVFLNLRATGALNLPSFTERVARRLGRHLTEGKAPEIDEVARAALRELATAQVLELLAAAFVQRSTPDREAIGTIFQAVPDRSIPALLSALAQEESPFGRRALLTALGRFGDKVAPFLREWLADERWFVVRNAIALLTEVGEAKDAPALLPFLNHANPKVRVETLRFFTRFPVSASERAIIRLVEDPDPEVRQRAVFTLGARGGRQSFEFLTRLARKPFLGQGEAEMRANAIRGLGRMGGEEAVAFLRGILTSGGILDQRGHAVVQKAAVEALVEVGGERARSALAAARRRLRGDALRTAEDFLRRFQEGGG